MTFNPQKWLVDKKEFLTQRKTFNELEVGNIIYSKMIKKQKADDGSRNPISIISVKVPHNPSYSKKYKFQEVRQHPTQKPVELMRYLIKTYTNENDLVLDNCCGSGSTLVAAKQLKRNFIGIEISQKYVDIANGRLRQEILL